MSNPRYTLLKGKFHIYYPDLPKQGPEPDGDTITFEPDNLDLLKNFKRYPDVTKREMVKIRFEAIDALETHFPASGGPVHQQKKLGDEARNYMLANLGFKDIVYWPDYPNKIKSANASYMEGYILANGTDTYGRVIGFVYSGSTFKEDGVNEFVNDEILKDSVNYKLLSEGLVYPAFYTSLPIELVQNLANEVKRVRKDKLGLWSEEHLNVEKSIPINGVSDLKTLIIWPKLFRRLVKYYKQGFSCLEDFLPWLHLNVEDDNDELILPNREKGNLHDLFAVRDGAINMLYYPEDIIIIDK